MTFAELLDTDKPVVVDFYADWCAPCRAMKPILEDLKSKMGEDVAIYKIDVDKNPAISEQFQVMSIPTLLVFKKTANRCGANRALLLHRNWPTF